MIRPTGSSEFERPEPLNPNDEIDVKSGQGKHTMTAWTIDRCKRAGRMLNLLATFALTVPLAGCGGDDEMLASPGRHWYAQMLTMPSVADDLVDVQRLIIVDRRNSLKWSGELPFPPGTDWQWRWLNWSDLEVQAQGYPTMRWRCHDQCAPLPPE